MAEQLVYVISDLHLGGAPGQSESERGFRMCTQGAALAGFITELCALPVGGNAPAVELVINGDFVDFLAEEDEPVQWTAIKEDPGRARELFLRIVQRNQPVFDALARFVGRGHTLTILIGNHDLELAFPAVRRALAEVLGQKPDVGLRFLHDGEAYAVGDALIEHGNRYDSFNMVDFDKLRHVRSLQSRGQAVPEDLRFVAPAGSQLVAEIMNPLKQHYPFIDLLKPETGAAVPLLLALAPGARRNVAKLASFALKARQHKLRGPALPALPGDIAATGSFGGPGPASDPFGSGGLAASDGLLAAGPAADGMAAFGTGGAAFRSAPTDPDEWRRYERVAAATAGCSPTH
jgi:UDP-2,3-diacylglucosamine pyrophosphatase LpxH